MMTDQDPIESGVQERKEGSGGNANVQAEVTEAQDQTSVDKTSGFKDWKNGKEEKMRFSIFYVVNGPVVQTSDFNLT